MRRRMLTERSAAAFAVSGMVMFVIFGAAVAWLVNEQLRDQERAAHAEITAAHAQLVLDQLSRASASTAALAAAMSGASGQDSARFAHVADNLFESIGGVSALAWAPDGTIRAVHPAAAAAGLGGLKLQDVPHIAIMMTQARSSKRSVIAGPLADRSGRPGLLAVAPILAPPGQPDEAQGFAVARVDLGAFLRATRLDRLPDRGQAYVLSETFAEAGKANVVARSQDEALRDPIEVRIDREVTHWVLSIAPRHERYAFAMHWAVGIVLLLGMLVGRLLHAHLMQMVALRNEFEGRRRAEQGLRDARSQLKFARDEIHRHKNQDGLTGLGSRSWFSAWLEIRWLETSRDGLQLAILVFDVDAFAAFNTARGHSMGDACLRQIAGVLKELHHSGDGVARLDNDAFVVAMLGADEATARALAERTVAAVAGLGLCHDPGDNLQPVTLSCGVVCVTPKATMAPNECLHAAIAAMERARGLGGNHVVASTYERTTGRGGRPAPPDMEPPA